jgi:hypothetical protein
MILAALLTFKNSAAPLRWINFAVISSGVIVSFALLVECETATTVNKALLNWSLVAYFAPQLLMFFDKKKNNDSNVGAGRPSSGSSDLGNHEPQAEGGCPTTGG